MQGRTRVRDGFYTSKDDKAFYKRVRTYLVVIDKVEGETSVDDSKSENYVVDSEIRKVYGR